MHVLGPTGSHDLLLDRLLASGEMALRPFVVYNYMAIRKAVAGAYNLDNTLRTVELPSCEDIEQALVWLRESLRKSAVKSSALVYEDKHAVHSSDVAGVRSIASHDVDEALRNADGAADEGFEIPEPLPCGHEDDEEEVLKKRSVGLSGPMAMSHVGLMNTGTGPDAVLEATLNATFDVLKVPRDEKPCSEFVGNGKRLMESFWYMFILGRGLERFEGTISYAASRHLMLHYTNRFQRNSAFTLLLANQAQRHTVLRSVSAKVLPGSFSDVEELVRDPTFREQVEELMRHPRTASSKELLRKLLSLLNYCAKPSPWGAMERSACIAQLLAMMRRYGPASWFLTMAPDDVHSAQGFRLTLRINTNTSFPAIPEGFLSALQDFPSKFTSADGLFDFPLDEDFMQKQAAQNPASTTIMYQKIIRLIFGELLGVPAARHCGRTLPLRDRPRKLIGRGLAAFAVTEENGKGSHHSHSAVFGGAMPGLCTGAVEQQAVFDRLVEVLEAQVQADMPFELYVVSEARTVFNKFRGKKQYIDRPRVEWQEPPAILDDNGRLSEAFIRSANLTALRVQDHKVDPHPPTCHKGDDTGCRLGVYFVHPCKRTRAVNIRGLTFTCAKHGQGIIPSRNSFGKALLSPAELTCNPCVKPDAEPAELHPRKGCFPNGKSVLHVKSNDDGSASWLCISDAAKDAALERQLHQPADDAPVVPDDGDDPPSEEDDTNADDDPAVPAELARLIPREEKSSVVFEIKRPSIEWPAHEELQDVKKDMSDASVSEIFDRIWSGAASTEDIRSIEKELAQPEWADVKARFEGITLSEKRALLMAFSHLRCRNARLTCYNHILTAVLRCNTAPYLLGARESSRAAMFYLVKYMTKDSVKLSASLSTLIDAKEHIEKWVSTAEDSGESLRTLKHFLQRAINSYQAEVHDTQAVSLLMREPAHFSTELFESMASWEFVRTALRLHGLDESRWEAGLSVQRRPGGDDTLQEEEEREEEEEEIAAESKWTREQRESEMSGMGAPGGAGTYLDADGEVRIVPLSEHYRLRGPELQRFSPREYRSCVKVVQKSADEVAMFQARLEDGQEDITNRLCAGRRPNARVCCCTIPTHTEEPVKAQRPIVPPLDCLQFEFHPSHPLWGKWHQMLRSKLACVVHVGNPIPKEPLQLGAGKRVTELWLLRRERFAAFYMSTFVPWPQGELESDCTAPDVTPEAMLGWMAHNRSIAGGSAPSRERKISRGRLTELRHHAHALTMNVGQKKVFTQGRFRNRETWAPGGAGGGAGKGGSEGHQGDASRVDEAIDTLIAGQRSHIVDPEHCGNVARNETWALTLLGDLGISLPAAPIAGQQQQGSKVGSGASDLRRCGLLAGVDAKRAKEARARVHQELPVSAAPPSPAAPPVADSSTAGDGNRPTEDPPMPAEIGEVSDEQLEGMIAEWEAACEASKAADPDAPLPPPPLSQEQRLVCRRIVPTLFAISRVKRAGGSRRQYMQRVGKEHDRLFLLNGPAGAGKTEVVKLLHSTLSDMHIGTLVLTAFQGSAVVQLKDAVTTLTLFRFGRDASTKEESFDKNLSQDVRDRFAKYASASTLMVLVIDETSFIPPALLHHVDMRLQALLECDEPFGGLVIMLAGVSSSALAGVSSSALLTHCGRVGACLTLVVSAGRRLPPEAPDLWQGTPPGPRRAGHRCQVSRQQLQEAQAEAEAERRPVGDWC